MTHVSRQSPKMMTRARITPCVTAALTLCVAASATGAPLLPPAGGLTFIKNEGQWTGTYSEHVRCFARNGERNLLVTDDGVVFQTIRRTVVAEADQFGTESAGDGIRRPRTKHRVRNTVVKFPVEMSSCRPKGGRQVVRFIRKDFNRIVASGTELELVFPDCRVQVAVSNGGLRFECLTTCGDRACREFVVEANEQAGLWAGEGVEPRESEHAPAILWSTLFSGTVRDYLWNHFEAPDGSGIITHGDSESPDFPTTSGVFDDTPQNGFGRPDIQVAKFSNDGSTLLFSTIVGSPGVDFSSKGAAALDALGNIVVGGSTRNDVFPTTPDSYQPNYAGGGDGFVFRLKSDGSDLLWSTYVGGSDQDQVRVVEVDADDNILFTGSTRSDDFSDVPSFSMRGGGWDAVLGRFSPRGTHLTNWRYLGGVGIDEGRSVRVLSDGQLLAVGWTRDAGGWDLSTGGRYQQPFAGAPGLADTYIAICTPDLAETTYFTFFGGTSHDYIEDVVVDGDDIYMIGSTLSADLPRRGTQFQESYADHRDMMYSKWEKSANALKLEVSSYLGGGFVDSGRAISVQGGFVFLAGSSFGMGIPIVGDAVQAHVGGLNDGYFAVLESTTSEMVYSSFIGGSDHDQINDITPFGESSILVSGYSFRETEPPAGDFPTTPGAYQSTAIGLNMGFLSLIRWNADPGAQALPPGIRFSLENLNYPAYRLYDVSGRWVSGSRVSEYADLLELGNGVYFLHRRDGRIVGPTGLTPRQPTAVRVTVVQGVVAGYRARN